MLTRHFSIRWAFNLVLLCAFHQNDVYNFRQFCFSEAEDTSGLDLEKYHIASVTLKDVVDDPTASVVCSLASLYIHGSYPC